MSTIYQKIKGAADKKRRSFVSLESKDGTVSPTKLNQTLVNGSQGLSKKFVNHSNALMDGYESTLDADGATFGEDLNSDGRDQDFVEDITKYKSVAKKTKREGDFKTEPGKPIDASVAKADPETEAKEALKGKTTKTKRDGDFKNEDGDKLDVTDVVTLTPGEDKVEDYSKEWDVDAAGGLSYEEWIKKPGNKEKEDKFVESKTTKGEPIEEKSVEMTTSDEDKTVETPGTKKKYNMGWMESRNAKRATNVQRRQAKKETRQNERLIKKFERKGGTSDSERMSPEVRAAYAHFTEDKPKTKFDSKIGSTSGRDTEGTSETSTNTVQGSADAITLDADGNPIAKYKSATQTLTSPGKFKLKGSTYKKQ
mgnify:CR=1 FL=1